MYTMCKNTSMLLLYLISFIGVIRSSVASPLKFVNITETGTEFNPYSVEFLSAVEFEPIRATVVIYNPYMECPNCINSCVKFDLESKENPLTTIPKAWRDSPNGNLAIAIDTSKCDIVEAVMNVVHLRDQLKSISKRLNLNVQIVAVLDLFEVLNIMPVIDAPARSTKNPNPVFESDIIVNRLHGSESGVMFREFIGCQFKDYDKTQRVPSDAVCTFENGVPVKVELEFTYIESPWRQLFGGPLWIIYTLLGLFLYPMLGFHCYKALLVLSETHTAILQKQMNLQHSTLLLMFLLTIIRTLDFLFQFIRDVCYIWIPEVLGMLLWTWGFVLALVSLLMLVLYWSELLRETSRKLTHLAAPDRKVVLIFAGTLFTTITTLMILFALRVDDNYAVYLFLTTGILGTLAFVEGVGLVIYGTRIIFRLNNSNVHELDVSGAETHPKLEMPTSRTAIKKATKKFKNKVKRLKPITKLVIGCAIGMFSATFLAFASFVSPLLYVPNFTFFITFLFLFTLEISTYALIVYTVSPLTKKDTDSSTKEESSLKYTHSQDSYIVDSTNTSGLHTDTASGLQSDVASSPPSSPKSKPVKLSTIKRKKKKTKHKHIKLDESSVISDSSKSAVEQQVKKVRKVIDKHVPKLKRHKKKSFRFSSFVRSWDNAFPEELKNDESELSDIDSVL